MQYKYFQNYIKKNILSVVHFVSMKKFFPKYIYYK